MDELKRKIIERLDKTYMLGLTVTETEETLDGIATLIEEVSTDGSGGSGGGTPGTGGNVDLTDYYKKPEVDIKLNLKADKTAVTSLSNTVNTKANASDVTSLQTTVSGLTAALNTKADASALNAKANITDVDAKLAVKANITDVDTKLATKADSTALNAKADKTTVTVLSNAVNDKADKTQVDALNAAIGNKADTSTVTVLQTTVNTKANAVDVYTKTQTDTALNAKASVSDVINLTTNLLTETQTRSDADTALAISIVNAKTEINTSVDAKLTGYTTEQEVIDLLDAKSVGVFIDKGILNTRADLAALTAVEDFWIYHIDDENVDVYARYIDGTLEWREFSPTVDLSLYETSAKVTEKMNAAIASANSYTDTKSADKVDKEAGKSLSTNDFTDALVTKLQQAAAASELAIIEDKVDTVETTLSSKIDNEITRSTTAETTLTTNLASEVTRSTNKDNVLDTRIDTETTRALAAELVLDTKFSNEITRATTEETAIVARLALEETRSKDKDDELDVEIGNRYTKPEIDQLLEEFEPSTSLEGIIEAGYLPDFSKKETDIDVTASLTYTAVKDGFVYYKVTGNTDNDPGTYINMSFSINGIWTNYDISQRGTSGTAIKDVVFAVKNGDIVGFTSDKSAGATNVTRTVNFVPPRIIKFALDIGYIPDYANMVLTNHISTNNGSWTADKDGFIRCQINCNSSGIHHVSFSVNGVEVSYCSINGSGSYIDILPVKKDDVIKFTASSGFYTSVCEYIPPRIVSAEKQIAYMPDYSNQETINRLSTVAGTWTAEHDGFFTIGLTAGDTAVKILVNNKTVAYSVLTRTVDWATTLPIKAGDTVSIAPNNPSPTYAPTNIYCYYIPPTSILPTTADVSTLATKTELASAVGIVSDRLDGIQEFIDNIFMNNILIDNTEDWDN